MPVMEELTAIRARLLAATGGHWNADFTDDDFETRTRDGETSARLSNFTPGDMFAPEVRIGEIQFERKADVLFIIHAKQDIEYLLARVDELEKSMAHSVVVEPV